MKYYMGAIYDWRFATFDDVPFLNECISADFRDPNNPNPPTGELMIPDTDFFKWTHHTHFPNEVVDLDFYRRKHPEIDANRIQYRDSRRWNNRVTFIFSRRDTGEDVAFASVIFRTMHEQNYHRWELTPDDIGSIWWQQDSTGTHPDHRGQKHQILIFRYFTNMCGNHFGAFKCNGWLDYSDNRLRAEGKDGAKYMADSDGNAVKPEAGAEQYASFQESRSKFRPDHEIYLKHGAPTNQICSANAPINTTEKVGDVVWSAARNLWLYPSVLEELRETYGAKFGWFADWVNEVGYDPAGSGKLCYLPDPTNKTMVPFMRKFTTNWDWVDSTFL